MPTVLWRGWSHGKEWFDLSACCVEARRSSRLRSRGPYRGRVLRGASNEVGILNCAVAVASSAGGTPEAKSTAEPPHCIAEVRRRSSMWRPRRSASPSCTRTSCVTPPPASPSPAARTSKSCSRCSTFRAAMTMDVHGHLFSDRHDEVADALDTARSEAARSASAVANAQNPVAKCCQTPMWSTWPPTRRKVNRRSDAKFGWRPRRDSNSRSRLRRAVLYPLSYGGPGR